MRPNIFAVGSPQRAAVHACAASWRLIANRNATISKKILAGSKGMTDFDTITRKWRNGAGLSDGVPQNYFWVKVIWRSPTMAVSTRSGMPKTLSRSASGYLGWRYFCTKYSNA